MSDDTAGGGLAPGRLERMRAVLGAAVDRGEVPGLVALVHRRGETHVAALGAMAAAGDPGAGVPMRRDAIFRIASLTKLVMAVAAMTLVEECRIRLDDPVDDLLPELADRRVLRRPDGPLDDTVPADRPITVRDLLTFRMGLGAVMAPPGSSPIGRAMAEAGLAPSPDLPSFGPDEWVKRLGTLPLMHQPGATWMYDTGANALGVLLARATGGTLERFCRERIFAPLGMVDTGFHVPRDALERMPVTYLPDPRTGRPVRRPEDHAWDRPPAFESGSGGLVSTVDDYLALCRMLLDGGRYDGDRVLSRPSVELMTTDQLTPAQKAGNELFFGAGGWGFGVAVEARRDDVFSRPGRYGWTGGLGTTVSVDPAEDMITVLFTQVAMGSPTAPRVFRDFWTTAYAAIDD